MITAQDIHERTFEPARFNGYDKDSVDAFLDELAEDVANAQKENSVLKSKMKVLVDKIEEYRANEEALNQAVLSAQKLAIQIESDARARAAAMIADAERQVNSRIGSIAELTANEEKRLAAAREATAKYIESARDAFNKQLKALDDISRGHLPQQEAPAAQPAPSVDDAVRSIESTVARIQAEPSLSMDLDLSFDGKGAATAPFDSTQSFKL